MVVVMMVMVVSMVCSSTFAPPNRGQAAGAIVIAFMVIILDLPLSFTGLLCRRLSNRIDSRWLGVLTPGKSRVGEWEVRGTRTRHSKCTSTSSDTRKHAAEFALDSWLAGWCHRLWLCSLHCLW